MAGTAPACRQASSPRAPSASHRTAIKASGCVEASASEGGAASASASALESCVPACAAGALLLLLPALLLLLSLLPRSPMPKPDPATRSSRATAPAVERRAVRARGDAAHDTERPLLLLSVDWVRRGLKMDDEALLELESTRLKDPSSACSSPPAAAASTSPGACAGPRAADEEAEE